MINTKIFQQGLLIGFITGLLASSFILFLLTPKPAPPLSLIIDPSIPPVSVQAELHTIFNSSAPTAIPSSEIQPRTEISHRQAQKQTQTSPAVTFQVKNQAKARQEGEARLQTLLAQLAYQDLSEHARTLINEQHAAYAWHYLIEAEIQQGFYTNAINLTVEHINSAFTHAEREQAIQTALNTLQKIDLLERSKGNTLQLIELYQYSIEILNPWINNTNSQIITLSKLYLSIGESNLALNSLNAISSNNPEAEALKQKIEKDSFITQRIPLKKYGKHYLIEVFIDNQPLQLLLDTGASISTINKTSFQDIESLINFEYLNNVQVNTAGGTKTGQAIQLTQFFFANKVLNDTQFIVLDMQSEYFDGLLGMNILENFEFTLDQRNHELVLSKPL